MTAGPQVITERERIRLGDVVGCHDQSASSGDVLHATPVAAGNRARQRRHDRDRDTAPAPGVSIGHGNILSRGVSAPLASRILPLRTGPEWHDYHRANRRTDPHA